jgi:hypothetical protein
VTSDHDYARLVAQQQRDACNELPRTKHPSLITREHIPVDERKFLRGWANGNPGLETFGSLFGPPRMQGPLPHSVCSQLPTKCLTKG